MKQMHTHTHTHTHTHRPHSSTLITELWPGHYITLSFLFTVHFFVLKQSFVLKGSWH